MWSQLDTVTGSYRLVKSVNGAAPTTKLSSPTLAERDPATSWGGDQLGAATSSSLDATDSPGACDDAGVHYCFVTVTGPLSFTLSP
jgi:hypothetical protein